MATANGLIDLFVVGTDGGVYTAAFSPAAGWNGWWWVNMEMLNCNFTGGSSGGPWLIGFNGHWGYINSVNDANGYFLFGGQMGGLTVSLLGEGNRVGHVRDFAGVATALRMTNQPDFSHGMIVVARCQVGQSEAHVP